MNAFVTVGSWLLVLSFSCSARKPEATMSSGIPGPAVTIYKLRGEWQDHVPVTLAEDGKSIVSYPSPVDVRKMEKPVKLKKDWWMDVRSINRSTAFLDMTMAEYGLLKQAPPLQELFDHIISKAPFERLYSCGTRDKTTDQVKEFTSRIQDDELTGCESLLKP